MMGFQFLYTCLSSYKNNAGFSKTAISG